MKRARKPRPIDVAVLDARERAALVAARALGRRGLAVGAFAAEPAPVFSSRRVCTTGLIGDYALDEEGYVRSVLDLVSRHRPKVVIPVHDGSIEALRARRGALPAGTSLALAADEPLAAALDKGRTFSLAHSLGLPLPRMVEVAAGTGAASVAAEVGLPAVIKPKRSWTSGSDRRHTSVVAATMPQLEAALDAVVGAGLPAVAQEWAPGRREAIWIFRAAGRTWARFAQVAYRTYPALGGQSVIRESIALPRDALEASEALVEAIDLEGFSEVEFRRDAAGRPLLMEINPRVSASIELAARAGLDFPALIYAWAAGTPLEAVRDYRIGVRMRWLGGDLRWLLAALHGEPGPDVPSRALAVARFAAAFLQPHRYDYLSASDPLPALRATADFVRRGFRVRRPGARARPTPRAAT